MRIAAWWIVGVALGACADDLLAPGECARACDVALRCGFLPSSLGGHLGDPEGDLREECGRRCRHSSASPETAALLGCLSRELGAERCEFTDCAEAAACVDDSTDVPDEVLGAPSVTVRALDGALWAAVFEPALCADASAAVPGAAALTDLCERFAWAASLAELDPRCEAAAEGPLRAPLCAAADCDAHEACDPTMCRAPFASAATDCALYGVTSVQLGYRDALGVLRLSPTPRGCDEASAGERFEGAPHGGVAGVALFRGALTAEAEALLGFPEGQVRGRPFCWASWPPGPRRQTRSDGATIVAPTPTLARLVDAVYERDQEFPVGCGCVLGASGCEVGALCANGVDDDGDGLVDGEDFGCRPPAEQECSNGVDDDGDGRIDVAEVDACR